jgi:hypothetical protein
MTKPQATGPPLHPRRRHTNAAGSTMVTLRCLTCGASARERRDAPGEPTCVCGEAMVVPPTAPSPPAAHAWLAVAAGKWRPAEPATLAVLAAKCEAGAPRGVARLAGPSVDDVSARAREDFLGMLSTAGTAGAGGSSSSCEGGGPVREAPVYVSRPWCAHSACLVSRAALRKVLTTAAVVGGSGGLAGCSPLTPPRSLGCPEGGEPDAQGPTALRAVRGPGWALTTKLRAMGTRVSIMGGYACSRLEVVKLIATKQHRVPPTAPLHVQVKPREASPN